MDGPDCIEAEECRGDFWLKFEEAVFQAGGNFSVEKAAAMNFGEIVNILAQNGIRMTFSPDWTIGGREEWEQIQKRLAWIKNKKQNH